MDQKCFPLLRGEVIRVTRLDACGAPVNSACSVITTDGFVEIALTSRITEGETVEVKKANGKTCIKDTAPSTWDGWSMNITFCNVDPLLFSMLTGQHVVYDANGVPIGFSLRDDVDLRGQGVALELWSNVPSGSTDACADGGAQGSWGYSIFPFVQGGVFGDRTINNGEVTFSVQNMQTKAGAQWGVGTSNVIMGADGTTPTTLLDPIGSREHERMFLTTVAPPEPGCSCDAVGTEATGAAAGAPGTWSPADTYAPFSFDDLVTSDPTATPSSAWTSGQYVVLGDGTHAYWGGSAWVEGEAP
jgi:hypothetical protein